MKNTNTVLESMENLPFQIEQAFREVQLVSFPSRYKKAKQIVICGMGGSRFPALIVYHLFKSLITIPFTIVDDYSLPGSVGKDTLVVLSSYSGTTEEVMSCAQEAIDKKAMITGITEGGMVVEFLKKRKLPHYQFVPKYNPSGQPRIGFGYGVGAQMGLLLKLGFLKGVSTQIENGIKQTKSYIQQLKNTHQEGKNMGMKLAKQIVDSYPYFIVAEFQVGVGNAMANQINETAKSISSFRVVPELNHHLMEGLKFPTGHKKMAVFFFFFSKLFSKPIQKRFFITEEVVRQNNIKTEWYELTGKTKVEQVFELMTIGSFASMYLSEIYKQDPEAIPYVNYFKKKMREMR